MARVLILSLFLAGLIFGQNYLPGRERAVSLPREFRAAWVATVYNIDWPSQKGLAKARQQAELRAILDRAESLNLNAIIFQVRPNADAVYQSSLEPWSHWISGAQGRSPGYDPLSYCIAEAHQHGIEVHAWFNPFRALPNAEIPTAQNHVVKTTPSVIRDFKTSKWMDPSSAFTQKRALAVMMDVVARYDIDGLHIDDYFYPYPDVDPEGRAKQVFPDGKSPEERRAVVDRFVQVMYQMVKKKKPWVRVGISPFGIWRPGVPAGTTARIDAYHHLAADSRKWLQQGWCDYLSPQLYWRIEGPQSFSRLLQWWRGQGNRPVWPGLASARIQSSEDPGRPAKELLDQVNLTRVVGAEKNYAGHVFWSMTSLMKDRGGLASELSEKHFREPALVPPMTWLSRKTPGTPSVRVRVEKGDLVLTWNAIEGCNKYAIQTREGQKWTLREVTSAKTITLEDLPDAVAISAVDRFGNVSQAFVLTKS